MIDTLLSYIAPHLCFGCGKTGALLCDNCKYNITEEISDACITCGAPAGVAGICGLCTVPYDRAWHLGERTAVIRRLVDAYKFENVYDAHTILADLLAVRLGTLPSSTILVPIPTIGTHIRQRGYDHTLLLAKRLAKRQNVSVSPLLKRQQNTMQRGASKQKRVEQAKKAYIVNEKLDKTKDYLIIDDILTTGATIFSAAKALKDAGAQHVWAAVIARQPLD